MMKYNLIRIDNISDNWIASYRPCEQERVAKKTFPSPLGYFYAPYSLPLESALEELKSCMITSHLDKIDRLKKSVEALQKVSFTE